MDIFSKFGLFSCFKTMDGSVDTLMTYVKFMGDSWDIFVVSDYLNVMLLKCDGKSII